NNAGIEKGGFKTEGENKKSSTEMRLALDKYIINFSNMWKKKAIFHKLVNHLIFTLLSVHLAPKRIKHYMKFKKEQQQHEKEKLDNDDRTPLSSNYSERKPRSYFRNKRRNAIRCEQKKINKYKKRQAKDGRDRESKIVASEARIEYFKRTIVPPPVLDRLNSETSMEVILHGDSKDVTLVNNDDDLSSEEEDHNNAEEDKENADVSRRRLKVLSSLIKDALFSNDDNDNNTVLSNQESLPNRELEVCLKIIKFIQPYIPYKDSINSMVHQLPFVLLSNTILELIGKKKAIYIIGICPLPSISQTNSLAMNAVSLYQMMTRVDPVGLQLFDYEQYPIQSEEDARRQKDATFNSIFDMKKIKDLCKSYGGLEFAHQVTFMPGCKTIRILEEKRCPVVQEVKLSSYQVYRNKLMNDAEVINESRKSQETLVNEIKILQETINKATNIIKEKPKILLPLDREIRDLKLQWKKKNDQADELHNEQALKKKCYDMYTEINKLKLQVKNNRHSQYIKRGALKFGEQIDQKRSNATEELLKANVTLSKQGHGLFHASDTYIDPTTIEENDFTFSGTDNGLVSMTNTVGFILNRFRFHLELSNRYQSLEGSSDINSNVNNEDILEKYEDHDYLNLPKSHVIKSKEIQ
ncbi:hypothetical protein ABG067_007835, partial [Albugo candida]